MIVRPHGVTTKKTVDAKSVAMPANFKPAFDPIADASDPCRPRFQCELAAGDRRRNGRSVRARPWSSGRDPVRVVVGPVAARGWVAPR